MTEQFNHEPWTTAATKLAISNSKPGSDFLLSDNAILDVIFKNAEAKLGPIVILFIKISLGRKQLCQLLVLPKWLLMETSKANAEGSMLQHALPSFLTRITHILSKPERLKPHKTHFIPKRRKVESSLYLHFYAFCYL